ncbi:MAG: hypothetical protein JSS32_09390 [Verrucomicrobia bacterium]|nr:hypothetical protein [Verrucomicrobiota bacterium]
MRRWFWLIALLVILAAFIFLFPFIASTPNGRWLFIKFAEKKTGAKIEMASLQLSWMGPQKFEGVKFQGPKIDGSWESLSTQSPLWKLSKLQGEFVLTGGNFSFHTLSQAQIENVQATIQGTEFTAIGRTRQGNTIGSFQIQGTAEKLPSDFSLEGNVTSMPTLIVDQLADAKGLLVEAFGPTFSAQGSITSKQRAGSLDLSFTSPNGKSDIHGDFDGKNLTLRQPLTLSLRLSSALSAALLKDVNPLFLTGAQARDPIQLRVQPDQFSFPYARFEWKNLSVGQATLDMGRVRVQNGSTLQSIMSLLQNSRFRDNREMNAWFTPVDFQIKNGVIDSGRLDALLGDSVHVCTWGRINMNTDQLDMYLGLPADTLSNSFGIQGFNPDYVLKIPIRGTTKNPELQSGPAAAQIAAMAAAQNLPLPKAGKIIGKVFSAAAQLKNDPEVPPAKRPFPWER